MTENELTSCPHVDPLNQICGIIARDERGKAASYLMTKEVDECLSTRFNQCPTWITQGERIWDQNKRDQDKKKGEKTD